MLPDNSRLAKLFYSRNGNQVLRGAAQKLGGYAVLEALTRPTVSYTRLVEAVDSGSVDSVVKLAESAGLAQNPGPAKAEGRKKGRKKVLYTVDDFLAALVRAPEAKMPAEQP